MVRTGTMSCGLSLKLGLGSAMPYINNCAVVGKHHLRGMLDDFPPSRSSPPNRRPCEHISSAVHPGGAGPRRGGRAAIRAVRGARRAGGPSLTAPLAIAVIKSSYFRPDFTKEVNLGG